MGLFRALKTNARRALAGSWGRAIGIMLISVIPGVLINLLEYGIREVSGVSEFVNRSGTATPSGRRRTSPPPPSRSRCSCRCSSFSS